VRLRPQGPFSPAAAARFQETFPAFSAPVEAGMIDLAFPADDTWAPLGVRAQQHE